jgi:NCS1 family nucleobase:cation symporter-1
MTYIQAALFLALTVAAIGFLGKLPVSHGASYGMFLLELAAIASYSFSWSPYASDYARYLPPDTSRRHVFWMVFWGSWLACVWVEAVGAVAGALGLGNLSAVGIVQHLMGRFAVWAELAIVFGTLTANALNSYTCTISLLTLDLRFLRPYAAGMLALLGGVIAVLSSSNFMNDYQNFLLLLSYWIAPWIAITLVGYYAHGQVTTDAALRSTGVGWRAIVAFLAGLAITVPLMNTTLFEGPVAKLLNNGDISYYLGFIVAGIVFWAWGNSSRAASPSSALSH